MVDPSSSIYSYHLQEEDHYRNNHYAHFASLSAAGNAFNMASPGIQQDKFPPIVMENDEDNQQMNHEVGGDDDGKNFGTDGAQPESSVDQDFLTKRQIRTVRRIDILEYLTNSLAGKDKLTKILKYSLDLLRLLISNSRANITKWDPTVLMYYKKVLKNINIKMILRHPITISKILLVAIFENFESKASFISDQLSTYRYILRFGGTPFRVVKMLQRLQSTELNFAQMEKVWFNESSLRDFIDLYYGICDEMVLLHKLKVWSQPNLYRWFARHESISWQYDILLNLKNNWLKLQSFQRKIVELQIQLQVRTKALKLSANLQGSPGYSSPIRRQLLNDLNNGNEWHGNDVEIKQQIDHLKSEKFLTYLDLTRLTFDCLANTTDIFNMKVPPGTYAILSLSSGITGLAKLWISERNEQSK